MDKILIDEEKKVMEQMNSQTNTKNRVKNYLDKS